MTLESLGPMLDELQTMLSAVGCKVTEMSVTLYPQEDEKQKGTVEEALAFES
ncbi:hypothetical protein NKDENANG_01229 [Candidatus Entotheonellaceae bacterium PAL068K]